MYIAPVHDCSFNTCFGGSDLAMCSRALKLDHDVCMLHNIVFIPLVGGDKEKRASISLLCVHLGILCIGSRCG